MKHLLISLALLTSGCSSYLRDGSGIVPEIDHRFEGRKLIVDGIFTNNTPGPVTFVRHPDFAHLSLSAADMDAVADGTKSFISFLPAKLKDLETVQPGDSFRFKKVYLVERLSSTSFRLTEYPTSAFLRSFTMRDNRVEASLSYGFYEWSFPRGMVVRPRVLQADVKLQKQIDIE